jgi:hypothetical protein
VQCSAVQCSAVQCSAMQCSAVQCSAVQCSAVQCSAVQCVGRQAVFGVLTQPTCVICPAVFGRLTLTNTHKYRTGGSDYNAVAFSVHRTKIALQNSIASGRAVKVRMRNTPRPTLHIHGVCVGGRGWGPPLHNQVWHPNGRGPKIFQLIPPCVIKAVWK